MGIFDRFTTKQATDPLDVSAALAPYNSQQLVGGILFGTTTASREAYMAVPAGARFRIPSSKPLNTIKDPKPNGGTRLPSTV